MSEVSAQPAVQAAPAAESAPAPAPQVEQQEAPQMEQQVQAPMQEQPQAVPEPQQEAAPTEPTKSVVGDLFAEAPEAAVENDYNYDYDDIQLENGVVGGDGDKRVVNSIAKELGLSREQARKLYERGGAIVQQEQVGQRNALIQKWNNEIQNDPEVGGANLQKSISDFKLAMKSFGSPELTQVLKQYPIYQSPVFFKFFAKVGQSISSDNNFTNGTQVAPRKLSEREEFLRQFPNSEYLLKDDFN